MGANRIIRPRNKSPPFPPRHRRTSLHRLSRSTNKRNLCKPTEEQNQRLTHGLSASYHRSISGTGSALFSLVPTSGTTPFCLCKPFSCKACPGIICYGGQSNYTSNKHYASTDLILLLLDNYVPGNFFSKLERQAKRPYGCRIRSKQNKQRRTGRGDAKRSEAGQSGAGRCKARRGGMEAGRSGAPKARCLALDTQN